MTFAQLMIFGGPRAWAGLRHCGFCLILLTVSLFAGATVLSAAEQPLPPQVLILNSYHPGYIWSDDELAGVLQELRQGYPNIDPVIEYLDTKRFPNAEQLLNEKDHLVGKYRGHKFDLIIVLDNPALMMLLDYRSELFPGTPIIFAGINNFNPAMLAGQEKVTGVAEKLDIESTLKTMLALHPETAEIFVVTDDTMTGKIARKEVAAIASLLPAGVRVEFAPPATMTELVERIKRLPATAILFIYAFATDKAGQTFSMAEGVRLLTQEGKVPAYIVHEGRLGHGPVGGMLLGGKQEGRLAGEIALRVLAGEDPSSIPVDTKSNARPMFDHRQLERFKIPESALPAGSLVINRPSSFYEIHRSLVWGAFGVVLVLGLVAMVLGVNIARRRRAENELQNHLGFLQNLLDTIPNPVFYKDVAGVYQGCNRALEEFLGLSREEIIGKTVYDTYPKDLADKYFAMDQELFHHPGTQVYEFDIQWSDGARRKFIFTKATFLDPEGGLGGLIGMMTDITARQEAEEALRQSEATLKTILRASPTAIGLVKNRVIQWVNEKMMQISEYTHEELLGQSARILYPSEDEYNRVGQIKYDQIQARGWGEIDTRWQTRDGRLKEISLSSVAIDPADLSAGVVFTAMDITERKQAEEALQQSEERLRLVFENAPIGIMHYDQTSIITDSNAKFAEIIGAPREQIAGFNMIRQLQDDLVRQAVAASLNGEVGGYESDYLSVTGGKLTSVKAIFQPIFSPEGVMSGGIAIVEDITERKRAEEELRLKEKLLDSASDSIFLHDLEGKLLYVNEAAYITRWYRKEELLSGQVSMLTSPEAARNRENIVKELLANGELIFESEHLRKDGSVMPVEIYARVLEVGGRELILSVARDITERLEAEEARKLNEARLTGILGISQYHAASSQDLLNYALEEAIALTASKIGYIYFYDDATQQFTLNTWSREVMRECTIAEPQTIYQLERTGIWGEAVRQARPIVVNDFHAPHPLKKGCPAGHALLHKFLTIPVLSDNRIVAVVGVANKASDYVDADVLQLTLMMDAVWKIVERRRVEEEVQAAAHKWRTTFNAITDGVCLLDPDGIILQCNQGMTNLMDKAFADILGRHCYEVVHGTSQPIQDCPLVRMRESRQREEMLLPMGGRWYKVGVDPILDEAGNLMGAVHIISDVTQLTETERSLYRRNEELMLLNTIGSIVSRSLDLHEVLDNSLWVIQHNLFGEHSRAIVFLADEATGELNAASHRGVPGGHPCLRRALKVGDCLCGRAALQGEAVFSRAGCAEYAPELGAPDSAPHQDISLPLKVRDRLLGVLHLSVSLDQEVDERHLKLLKAIADQISMAVEKARLFEQVKLQGTQMRTLSARLAEIEEAERMVLARELHDQVGQSLTTLSLYLTMLQEQMPRQIPEKILTRLTDAATLVEETADSVREIMAELRPPVLDDFGLLAAARWLGKQFSQSTGINLQFAGQDPTPRLDRKVEMGLFRIIQEALNNVAKHARASQVTVTEEVQDDRVCLTIADNGIGFEPTQLGQPEGRHRWGLMNMNERALAAGGTCRIDSQPGQGTRVIVEVSR
jgi:PAS domain S-box-containing protein